MLDDLFVRFYWGHFIHSTLCTSLHFKTIQSQPTPPSLAVMGLFPYQITRLMEFFHLISQLTKTTGLEPATTGSTVQYSNQLSYVSRNINAMHSTRHSITRYNLFCKGIHEIFFVFFCFVKIDHKKIKYRFIVKSRFWWQGVVMDARFSARKREIEQEAKIVEGSLSGASRRLETFSGNSVSRFHQDKGYPNDKR